MAEAKAIQDKVDQTSCSFQDKHQPVPFFQRFSSEKLTLKKTQVSSGGSTRPLEELNLNLRLSLGGIYSENTAKEKPLTRSSSIAGEAITLKKIYSDDDDDDQHQLEDDQPPLPTGFLSLARSCSLPAEVERSNKRVVNLKELRIMRRFEAKKRAVEKQRNATMKGGEKVKLVMEGPPSSPSEIPAWAAASAAKSPALNRAIDKIKEGFRKLQGLESSGTPKGPSDSKSSSKPIKAEPEITSETKSNGKFVKLEPEEPKSENPTKKAKLSNGCIQGNGMDVMKKMPSVTTTGDGPSGRKIEGFLYKYMKGQVSIVCLCHGSFLSPEEFVKHAGGKDVTNPMKHINVCSTFFSY